MTPGAKSASGRNRRCSARLGGPFRLETFHLGFLYRRPVTINLIRDGHRRADPLFDDALRLRTRQAGGVAAGQFRVRRFPAALSAERPACERRGDLVPRRELFSLSGARAKIWALRSGPLCRSWNGARKLSLFPRVLDRDPRGQGEPRDDLWSPRRQGHDRRLPFRFDAGPGQRMWRFRPRCFRAKPA